MDRGAGRALVLGALLAGCLFVASPLSAQLVLGQYEDEAPLGSWNVLGSPSAPSAGAGVLFARLADASISFSNPALLVGLPRLSACVSTSYAAATLRRFSLVNTGVVSSSGNPGTGVLASDHGAVALRSGGWALALGISVPESYVRPTIVADSGGSSPSYELRFGQTGTLRIFHGAVSRRLFKGWSIGLGLNFASGSLSRTTVERTESPTRTVIITDDKHESLRGFFLNGGIAWEATGRLTASLVFRSSYRRRGDGASLYRYEVPEAGTDIRIDGAGAIEYFQPWVVGAGCSYRLSETWAVAAEAAWFGWSAYQVIYFDEPSIRMFRDIVRAGGGAEYLARVKLFGAHVRLPLRLGVSYDPQPMGAARSAYLALTLGTGVHWRALAVDVGGWLGRENGSGDALRAAKIVLSLRYIIDP
jgi:long-subunit fatty acid transport protein